jgi:hypothetical protein
MVRGGIPPVDFETLASLVMVPVLTVNAVAHSSRVGVRALSQLSNVVPEGLYEGLREAAFRERCKIHPSWPL